jgi:glycosyltransferase involved in cell wall biosynthesis
VKITNETKTALVCDWLTGTGGAERVVLEFHKMFPDAPIYTSQYNKDQKIWYGDGWFADADVRTLSLQKLPKSSKKLLPVLRAKSFSKLDLSGYELVISSSGAEAKAVKTGPKTIHITYCHAPTHYYWSRYDEYMENPGFGALNPLARLSLKTLVGRMREWDYQAAQRPDYFIANSRHTKEQIKKYYGRDSVVIHPPVNVERFKPREKKIRNGFLIAGRQTSYKRFDLAVEACTKLGLPLTVIGNGPEHDKLVKMAGPRVTFLTNIKDEDMPHYFQKAEAFIFPGIDDFGIVAVESLAAGTPVVAYKAGGAMDYVKEGKTGLFFGEQTAESLAETLTNFDPGKFKAAEISKSADKFSDKVFIENIKNYLEKLEISA